MLIDAVKNKKLDDIENDLARLIPRSVDLSTDDERCRHLANRIREFYFKGKKVSHDTMNELVDLNTDYHFTILAYLAAELHARYQNRCAKRDLSVLFFNIKFFSLYFLSLCLVQCISFNSLSIRTSICTKNLRSC